MEERKEQKRELIFSAAMKLFLSKGYTNTKIIDIAVEAGIGKGTVYEYFASKEELFCELFRHKVVAKIAPLSSVLEEDMSYAEKLKAVIHFDVDNSLKFESYKHIISYSMMESEMSSNKELMSEMRNLMEKKLKLIYDIVKGGIDSGEFIAVNPHMAALSIFGAINFYLCFGYDYITPPENLKMKKNVPWKEEEFYDLLFYGLKDSAVSSKKAANQ